MEKKKIVIGSRGSDLALWQAHHVQKHLQENLKKENIQVEIKIIKTSGDVFLEKSLQQSVDKGFFTKEIEEELLAKKIDLAVHSLKDLPTAMPNGLHLCAVSERAAVSDLLLIHYEAFDRSKDFPLEENSIVGATSLRRQSLLKKFAPHLQAKMLRGNVPSRIRKLKEKQYDAIILAEAGIERLQLDLSGLHVFRLNKELWIPAPAQGVLGLQSRVDDETTNTAIKNFHSQDTFVSATIERELLSRFEGGCHSPFGALAQYVADEKTGEKEIHVLIGHESPQGVWKSAKVFVSEKEETQLKETAIKTAYEKMKNVLENKEEEHVILGDDKNLCRKYVPSVDNTDEQ